MNELSQMNAHGNMGEQEESGFDFMQLFRIILTKWYWVLLSVIICFAAGKVYLHFQKPVYASQMKILVKERDNGSRRGRGSIDMSTIGMMSNSEGFDNELETLVSKSIAQRTVLNLKLYVSYERQGRFRDVDLYKNSPILVDLDEAHILELRQAIRLRIKPAGEGINVEGYVGTLDMDGEPTFREHLSQLPAILPTNYGQLIFTPAPGQALGSELYVTVSPVELTANMYRSRMSATPSSKTTTVAVLRITDTNIERANDYLDELVRSYNTAANEEKNEISVRTEEFINNRIAIIQSELDSAEIDLEQFKVENGLINLPNDATMALNSSTQYQERQVQLQVQMTMLAALTEYVNDPANAYRVIPANLGLVSGEINSTIASYNTLVLQRQRLVEASNDQQPVVRDLTMQIDNMRLAVKQMLTSQYDSYMIQKRSIDERYNMFYSRVANTPGQERAINNITRQQEIKAGLYLMLLQRREENLIQMESTAAKARVIDAPEAVGLVAPNTSMIRMLSLLLGLALPILFFYLRELLRFKVEGQDDVKRLTSLPLLASLPMSRRLKGQKERKIVISENTNNMMEEAFRGLRTNLRFVLKAEQGERILLVTSVVPGEGKTFVATNLAMSYALMGKRVCVVGLDIRRPRLARLFNLPDGQNGITNFLITDGTDTSLLESYIHHGVLNPNLDVLTSGAVPPNPGELIAQPTLGSTLRHLATIYDIVILDTPPMDLVSDSIEIARYADATLIVTRCNFSARSSLKWIDQMANEKKLPQMNIVLNCVEVNKKGKYYSRYGYKNGYSTYGQYGQYGTYGNYGDTNEKGKSTK